MPPEPLTPVLNYPCLGPLYPHGGHQLIGSVYVDPAIRVARADGTTDAEVVVEIGSMTAVDELTTAVGKAAARICEILANLGAIKYQAVDLAPVEWRDCYAGQGTTPLATRLFLEGFEVNLAGDVVVYFDFGDLDMLAVRLDAGDRVGHVDLVG